jgi:hypothetical protein
MAFRFQDLVMSVHPEHHEGGPDDSEPDCVPSQCEHSECSQHDSPGDGDCIPSQCGDSKCSLQDSPGEGEHRKHKRHAADLAALRRQLRESLAGAP